MAKEPKVFIWTEVFNCAEILPPFLESFRRHHNFPLHVFTSKDEVSKVPPISGVTTSLLPSSMKNWLLRSSQKSVLRGYRKGHLGTARLWSNVIRSRAEEILIHVDADTIFLDDCITPLIESIQKGADIVGTRRPYLYRNYRKEGRDGRSLDRRPDSLNTDLIAFRRAAVPRKNSPLLTRRIRGRRPIRYPVVDFFDPVVFQMIEMGKRIVYYDSPNRGYQSKQDPNSKIFTNRISFAAVGSGLNFLKSPDARTSPGYRAYAIASYSLFAKHLLEVDTGIAPLENPELVDKLARLDKENWILKS